MKKIFGWLQESNHCKHLVGGLLLGLLSNSWFCTMLVGASVAGALEFKDWQWGGKPDVIDFLLTFVGAAISFFVKWLILLN